MLMCFFTRADKRPSLPWNRIIPLAEKRERKRKKKRATSEKPTINHIIGRATDPRETPP